MSQSQVLERRPAQRGWNREMWERLRVEGCETCDGEQTITVMASDGAWMDVPCPCCAPNDSPGG